MNIDLRALTRKELEKLREDVDKALERAIERDRKSAMAAAKRAAKQHGFDLSELASEQVRVRQKTKATKKRSPIPKYRHPDDPNVTWTGKGRPPRWIVEVEASGRSRDTLLIKK